MTGEDEKNHVNVYSSKQTTYTLYSQAVGTIQRSTEKGLYFCVDASWSKRRSSRLSHFVVFMNLAALSWVKQRNSGSASGDTLSQ